jgi:hypothetical protein
VLHSRRYPHYKFTPPALLLPSSCPLLLPSQVNEIIDASDLFGGEAGMVTGFTPLVTRQGKVRCLLLAALHPHCTLQRTAPAATFETTVWTLGSADLGGLALALALF